jgi:tetraacyldisaccharide 4'-kinase
VGKVLTPLSWLYGAAVARRNRRFDRGVGIEHLDVPVISIGNISVGGTGKTPVCRVVVDSLRHAGRTPAIALRGYAANANGESDEALEYAMLLKDVPLAVGADRVAALADLRVKASYDCVVLDDGFQHRQIARNLDVVLIDATRPRLDDRLLPAGRLREPAAALARADVVLVTRATEVDASLVKQIESCGSTAPLAWLTHTWSDTLAVHRGNQPSETRSTASLRGSAIATSLGVGNPESVLNTLRSYGATVVWDAQARDHQPYDAASVRRLCERAREQDADGLLLTPKDWVKVRAFKTSLDERLPVWVPSLELGFLAGEAAFKERLVGAVTLPA